MTWTLAVSYYPEAFPGWPAGLAWLMGAVTAIMLFVSVVLPASRPPCDGVISFLRTVRELDA